jgi:hypothetical protein
MAEQPLEDLARQAATGDETAADLFLDRFVNVLRLLDQTTLHRALHAGLFLEKSQRPAIPPPAANGPAEPSTAPRPQAPGAMFESGMTPELMEWARSQWTEEDLLAARRAVRELRENGGGLELQDFLPELYEIVRPSSAPMETPPP